MARQRDGSKIIILWAFSNPILQRSCHYRVQHGDFDMILGPVCQRQRQRFLSFMHSSISNDKSKARGVCSTSPFTSFKYDIETVRETVARGPRSQPYTQVYSLRKSGGNDKQKDTISGCHRRARSTFPPRRRWSAQLL